MPRSPPGAGTSVPRKSLCYAANRGSDDVPVGVGSPSPESHSATPVRMKRSLVLLVLLVLVPGARAGAQVLDDALVPGGRLRLEMTPIYTTWDSRFGRTESGETGREALGEDLTTNDAASLFPGVESLRTAIASMSGMPSYSPTLGETESRVSKNVTRVEFGAHLGIFDWLTVGVVLPWTRTRANVDVNFRPDTTSERLGRNPSATDPTTVDTFLQALQGAEADAVANATAVCAASPGSAACASAQSLADRTAAFQVSATQAYDASAFFPVAGTATAASLDQATASLDADLVAAGLPGIGASMAFAEEALTEDEFILLPSQASSGIASSQPLGSVRGIWQAGDMEVSLSARILDGEVRDSAASSSRFSYRLVGTLLARLPTGHIDDPDVFLDVPTGDGQTDVEGRLMGELTLGRRFGIRGGARYGVQKSRTLIRRVVRPETILAPLDTRALVRWTPGSYFGLEVAPAYRFSEELSIAAEYRAFRKYRDTYELAGNDPLGGAPVDPYVLEEESGVTLHEVGGTLRYDTISRWLSGGAPYPLQFEARWMRAVAGGGGQTPVTTRIEFGVRVFRRIWGDR